MSPFLQSGIALDDLAVIDITGADAASFLHGQLTHDILGLSAGQARLAGYCTPKGRLLATLVVWLDPADPQQLHALVRQDIAASLVKRLSMYVLRAKARLQLASQAASGVLIEADGAAASEAALPARPQPWSVHVQGQDTWIAAPHAAGAPDRWWRIGAAGSPDQTAAAAWAAADIAAGLPWITAPTQDMFIPQTLNLELIDAVSFTKGCYPGQEIVARSHYRGTIKRRMAYGTVGSDALQAPAGGDIYNARQPDTPCGRTINAAAAQGQTHILFEVQLADLATADYRLGSAAGPAITLQALPYAIEASTPTA